VGATSRASAGILRAEVEDQGLSQSQVGVMLGRSQQHVSNLLSGNRSITVDELIELCDALGLDWLEGVMRPAIAT